MKVEVSTAMAWTDGVDRNKKGTIDVPDSMAKGQGNSKQGQGPTPSSKALENANDNAAFNREERNPVDPFPYARGALDIVSRAMGELKGAGTSYLHEIQKRKTEVPLIERLGTDPKEDEDLPVGPGHAYLAHLFKRSDAGGKIKEKQKKALTNAANIFTNSMNAVKQAMLMVGLYSDQNSGGLGLKLEDAQKIYFGGKEVDDIMKSQFNHDIQTGVNKMDPKKIRKFVNNDGSLTWEILNDDKTVQSRFTMGEYNGTNIFAQGGYSAFAELLKQAKQKLGSDDKAEFDAIRGSYRR